MYSFNMIPNTSKYSYFLITRPLNTQLHFSPLLLLFIFPVACLCGNYSNIYLGSIFSIKYDILLPCLALHRINVGIGVVLFFSFGGIL